MAPGSFWLILKHRNGLWVLFKLTGHLSSSNFERFAAKTAKRRTEGPYKRAQVVVVLLAGQKASDSTCMAWSHVRAMSFLSMEMLGERALAYISCTTGTNIGP